jgi:hypothetical protein
MCDHPQCTGVHKTSRPRAEWCPRTKQRHDQRPYRQSIKGQTMFAMSAARRLHREV